MTEHPVRLARYYAELTQTELATRLGIKQYAVARIEQGKVDYSPIVKDLEFATGLPMQFFDIDRRYASASSSISYRKRGACPSSIKDRAKFLSSIANSALETAIASHVRYADVQVPGIPMETPATNPYEARAQGAAAAKRVRQEWGVGWGPISNVIRLMESKGVRVFFLREPVESLDGFACWFPQRKPYVFLNSFIADPARMRFDACHELGHIVMHGGVNLDSRNDLWEAMAHGFAAEFLAPWETFSRECPPIPDIDRLSNLRRRWGISMQAAVKHMHANKAISDASYTNAFKKFSYLGYRRGPEPGWFMPDSSVMHAKFHEVIAKKGITISQVAESIALPETLVNQMIPAFDELF
jgi:Zn-dependent peptidase ImmA (M78 family)/transcriptional regulator with XRE-family HTH domain